MQYIRGHKVGAKATSTMTMMLYDTKQEDKEMHHNKNTQT